MELIRAYSNKVAGYLPRNIRQESADELYDSLCEQYEDSQDGQTDELEFLQAQPHPIRMATRMSEKESLYLIGPAFYLSFIEAIKVAAIIVGAIHVGVFCLTVWGSRNLMQTLLQTVANFMDAYLTVLIIIGIFFVVLEKAGERSDWLDKWSVKDLQQEVGSDRISKVETLFELNFSLIFFMWLLGVIQLPSTVRHDGVWLTDLTVQIPEPLLTIILVVLALDILVSGYKLVHGTWSGSQRLTAVALDVVWVALLVSLIQIDPLVIQDGLSGVPPAPDTVQLFNRVTDVGLAVLMLIAIWDGASHVSRLLKQGKQDG